MTYSLGIDVGTTYTAAAVFRDGHVEALSIGTYQIAVPSVIFASGDEMLFAGAAVRRGAAEPNGLAREFKRRLGDPVPIMLSGSPYHADRLTALMAKWVVDTVTEQLGGPPATIAMAHPANWTDYQLGILGHALEDVGLGGIALVSEPAAAALDYAASAGVAEGALLLVYDLGGGTFDVALLRRRGDGFEHEIEPFGIERLGGIDFDEAVFSFTVAQVPSSAVDAARQTPEGRAALAALRRACVDAKEALSSETATDVPVMLPDHTASVRITRGEFEDMIRPMVQQTIVGVEDTMARAHLDPSELDAALLVGGSSRIPLVPQLVGQGLRAPVRIDAHPKLVVAKGAARRAAMPDVAPVGRAGAARVPKGAGVDGPPARRRWLAIAAGAVALVVAGGVALALTRSGDETPAATATTVAEPETAPTAPVTAASDADTTAPTDPPDTTAVPSTLPLEAATFAAAPQCTTDPGPIDIALVETELWVASGDEGSLARCDLGGGPVVAEVVAELAPPPDEGTGYQLIPAGGALYVTEGGAGTVARVDPDTLAVERVTVEGAPYAGAVVGDTLWVGSHMPTGDPVAPGRLTPIVGTTAGTAITLPYWPGWMRAVDDEIWVAFLYNEKIGRIDPATGQVETFDIAGVPIDVLPVGDDQIWVTLRDVDQVAVFDRATQQFVDQFAVGTRPQRLIDAFGSIWVTNAGSAEQIGTVSRIDPATREEVQPPITVGHAPIALTAGPRSLFVNDLGDATISELAPAG